MSDPYPVSSRVSARLPTMPDVTSLFLRGCVLAAAMLLTVAAADATTAMAATATKADTVATVATVEVSPSGTVKNVRQFTARFAQPMVAFGDPRLAAPMEVSCPVPGRGR